MPLHFAKAPEASVNALHAVLPRIATRTSAATYAPNIGAAVGAALRRGLPDAPQAAEPISAPVHVLGLKQIADGADLKAAPVALWSHLLHNDDQGSPVAVADLHAETHAFAELSEGEAITALGRQIRSVEADSLKTAGDYDLALIRVPAMSLTALWLKGRQGAADVVIPNESPASPLTAGRRYSLAEFNAALRPVAQAILAQDHDDKGG